MYLVGICPMILLKNNLPSPQLKGKGFAMTERQK